MKMSDRASESESRDGEIKSVGCHKHLRNSNKTDRNEEKQNRFEFQPIGDDRTARCFRSAGTENEVKVKIAFQKALIGHRFPLLFVD